MPYDPHFITGDEVPMPALGSRLQLEAFDGGEPVHHRRFSIVMHATRGLAIFTAHAIDGATIIPEGEIEREDRFRFDPTVPRSIQIDNDQGYVNNPWDRGHLVRRQSMHWGERAEAEQADRESFYWTNIAPQHETLHHKAWGHIEDWMLEHAEGGDSRAVVFTGPVLSADDPEIVNKPGEDPIQIPAGFWKVVAVRPQEELRAAGFLVWQRDFDQQEPVDFAPYLEQVRITTIEFITGLSFGTLRNADPLRFGTAAAEPEEPGEPGLEGDAVDFGLPGAETPRPATGGVARSAAVKSAADVFI